MANFIRNPTETTGAAADTVSRASTIHRTVGETPLADNPNAVAITIPVFLVEEAV